MAQQSLIGKFLIWRVKHIQHKHFVLFLSVVVGLSSGLVTVIIKNSVYAISHLLEDNVPSQMYFILPMVGIFLTVIFLRYIVVRMPSKGIPATLYAISKKNSIMSAHRIYSSVISSAITVGFGGSAGLEGPTVSSNSAIGSNLGRILRLDYKTTTLLLGCGCAGSMAGMFNAPVAAIVFALEIIMLDLTMSSIIPLLMASVSATLTSSLILEEEILFGINLDEVFKVSEIPYYVMLGVMTGLISYFCYICNQSLEPLIKKFKNPFVRVLVGGSLLGLLIYLLPPLHGEGYNTIKAMMNRDYTAIFADTKFADLSQDMGFLILFLALLILLKIVATVLTFSAGGAGGIFSPALFIGANIGFVFAKAINYFGIHELSEKNFTLVGMAGLISGLLHAPLTALFLIAEITSGYELMIPLMLTVSISYLTTKYFMPHSIYTAQLAESGDLITHHKDKAVLTLMKLHTQVEKDFVPLSPDMNLGEVVEVVAKCKRNIFPVVDEEERLQGIILLDDIREIMFKPDLYKTTFVHNLMHLPPAFISYDDNMDEVMKKFSETGAWNLPVIDQEKYVGFVSKSKLFTAYRKVLVDFSED